MFIFWHQNLIFRLSFVSVVRCIFYDFLFAFCLLFSFISISFALTFVTIGNNVCACFTFSITETFGFFTAAAGAIENY